MLASQPTMTAATSARLALLLATFIIAARPTFAHAEDPPIDAVAASIKRFDEGRAAFEARRFDDARRAFEASEQLQASPNSLLYIARCYRETGKLASAYVTFKRSAREAHDRLTTTLEKRYAATRDAANAEAAELEAKVPRLVIAVPGGLPHNFVVTVDGKLVPPASWGIAVETDPGPVTVEARAPRMVPFRSQFTLQEGENKRVDVLVARIPTAMLSLTLASRPGGMTIDLDGSPVDPRDATDVRELDVGPHVITVRAPNHRPFRWAKSLADQERASVHVRLVPEPLQRTQRGTAPWLFFAAAGSAAVAMGIGAGFAVSANAENAKEEEKSPLVRDPSTRDGIRARSTIANGLFISGAVLGASATVLFFTTAWGPSRSERTNLRASASATQGTITLEGHF